MAPTRENLAPRVVQRVAKEIRQLVQAPPNGIRYLPQEEEVLTDIHVEIAGPENTPYDGGFFQVRLALSDGFPQAPPKGVFLTKIFHPNIATNGEICVNTLKKDWTPELGIAHVLQVIRCLLIVPFPESSLNDEAGRLFMESYDEYARRAKLWTNIHAPKQSAAKNAERVAGDKKSVGGATPTKAKDENKTNAAGSEAVDPEKKLHDPETTSETDKSTTKPSAVLPSTDAATTKVSVATGSMLPLTKKRTSPTSTDALAAKKKSAVKKGIKRL